MCLSIDKQVISGLLGPFEHGLLGLKDEQWKNARTIVSPTFSTAKLKTVDIIVCYYLLFNVFLFRCTV
jgi:hypothetical protein